MESNMTRDVSDKSTHWPAEDFTRVPYEVFQAQETQRTEQEKIFEGPVWNYLCLSVEIPNPGDFITSYVGRTQVIVNRADDGNIYAFVNTCAHRGAQLVRKLRGNAKSHVCAYHQWCFDHKGNLAGIPQIRGVKGKGGMPEDFDKASCGLKTLKVDEYRGLIFGTFSPLTEPLRDYLGDKMRVEIDRIFERKVKVLGYYRQRVPANWKLYVENVKDPYHAGLLHLFHVTFGIYRPTMSGRVFMELPRGHSVLRTADIDEKQDEVNKAYSGIDKYRKDYRLADPSMFHVEPDYDDKVTNMIMTIFPNVMLGQVANTFQTRHVRPKSIDGFELYWTYLAFEDDDDRALEGKLRQSNFVGPAGYISLEDGEAGRLVQSGVANRPRHASVVEMGGRGPIEDIDSLSTEVAVRGFWKRYAELMDEAVK